MKNFNMTAKSARVIGVVLILTGLVFAQVDTLRITVKFTGDIGTNSFTVVATPDPSSPSRGGGTLTFVSNSTNSVSFTNLSGGWGGKVFVAPSTGNYGFLITPKDTSFRALTTHVTFTVNVVDTAKPLVKISHLNGIITNVNQLFTFYDSIKENTKILSFISHSYSLDSGITWDSISYQQNVTVTMQAFMGYPQSFTPTKASDNFMLRIITADRFHALADTDIAVFKVKDNVGIYNPTKTVRPKTITADFSTYDLTGRKMLSVKGSSKFYIKNNQRLLIAR